jgi:hypothetical protein
VGRFTDIDEQIEENGLTFRRLDDLRDTIENVSSRAYDTVLNDYYLGYMLGFDTKPFIFLSVFGERLCEEFDQNVRPAVNLLERELCDADDDEAEWWIPVNAAAVQATKATLAWLKDVQLFQYRLSKDAESDLSFY